MITNYNTYRYTYRYTYIKENSNSMSSFQLFLFNKIKEKLKYNNFYIGINNYNNIIYIKNDFNDILNIKLKDFTLKGIQDSRSVIDSRYIKQIDKLLQDVIEDIETNYKHIIDANNFNLI